MAEAKAEQDKIDAEVAAIAEAKRIEQEKKDAEAAAKLE